MSVTKGSTTQHDDSCEDVHCFLSLLITLLNSIILVQNQFRKKITAATQKVMWQKGFYPGDTEYERAQQAKFGGSQGRLPVVR